MTTSAQDPTDLRQQALAAHKAGDTGAADALFEAAAAAGDTESMLVLGTASFRRQDPDAALASFRRAGLAGEPRGWLNGATLLERAGEGDLALAWYARTPDEPRAVARCGLVEIARNNLGAGGWWLRRAAAGGHVESMVQLVDRASAEGNRAEEGHWLAAAAERGHEGARDRLAAAPAGGSADPALARWGQERLRVEAAVGEDGVLHADAARALLVLVEEASERLASGVGADAWAGALRDAVFVLETATAPTPEGDAAADQAHRVLVDDARRHPGEVRRTALQALLHELSARHERDGRWTAGLRAATHDVEVARSATPGSSGSIAQLSRIARLRTALGQHDAALAAADEAVAAAASAADRPLVGPALAADALGARGTALVAAGRPVEAREPLVAAIGHRRAAGDRGLGSLAPLLLALVEVERAAGATDAALAAATEAVEAAGASASRLPEGHSAEVDHAQAVLAALGG